MWRDNCQNANYLLHDDKFHFQFAPYGISLDMLANIIDIDSGRDVRRNSFRENLRPAREALRKNWAGESGAAAHSSMSALEKRAGGSVQRPREIQFPEASDGIR